MANEEYESENVFTGHFLLGELLFQFFPGLYFL